MSTIVITVNDNSSTQAQNQQRLQLNPNEGLRVKSELAAYFKNSGNLHQNIVEVQTDSADPVKATGTITLSSVVATDAFTIGTITFTGIDAAGTAIQFDTSLATDALIAANIVSKVNAHPVIGKIVTASIGATTATVLFTCKVAGLIGNQIPLSSADGTITASASHLANGAGGATDAGVSYDFGG